jgi:hypothetical protein
MLESFAIGASQSGVGAVVASEAFYRYGLHCVENSALCRLANSLDDGVINGSAVGFRL